MTDLRLVEQTEPVQAGRPVYGRFARARLNDEILALKKRHPGLSWKLIAADITTLAELKAPFPVEYFHRLHRISDAYVDLVVRWISFRYKPDIRSALGHRSELQELAASLFRRQKEPYNNQGMVDTVTDALCGYYQCQSVDFLSPRVLIIAPGQGYYLRLLMVADFDSATAEPLIWTGVAMPQFSDVFEANLQQQPKRTSRLEFSIPTARLLALQSCQLDMIETIRPPEGEDKKDRVPPSHAFIFAELIRTGDTTGKIFTEAQLNSIMKNEYAAVVLSGGNR